MPNYQSDMANEVADKFAELPDDECIKVERLLRAIDVFREFDTAFPASYMAAFLLVALHPGKGSTDYARKLGSAQAVASRLMLEIGPKRRTGEPGLGLIGSEPDTKDLRIRRAFLTPKGKALLRKLMVAMGKA